MQQTRHLVLRATICAAIAALALVPLGAASAKEDKASSKKTSAASYERQFAKADTEGKGQISKKQAFKAQMYTVDRYFFDIDANGDGWLTLAELKAWHANPVMTAPRPRGDKLDRFVAGDETRRTGDTAVVKKAKKTTE